jgi:hypothetical protein
MRADFRLMRYLRRELAAGVCLLLAFGSATKILDASMQTATAAPGVFSRAITQQLDAEFRNVLRAHVLPSVATGVWDPASGHTSL